MGFGVPCLNVSGGLVFCEQCNRLLGLCARTNFGCRCFRARVCVVVILWRAQQFAICLACMVFISVFAFSAFNFVVRDSRCRVLTHPPPFRGLGNLAWLLLLVCASVLGAGVRPPIVGCPFLDREAAVICGNALRSCEWSGVQE